MRLIDADELMISVADNELAEMLSKNKANKIEELVVNAPTIDAVEVVRCKDCEYSDSCRQTVVITAVEKEERYRLHMEDKPLTFCSYGESARTDRGKQCD